MEESLAEADAVALATRLIRGSVAEDSTTDFATGDASGNAGTSGCEGSFTSGGKGEKKPNPSPSSATGGGRGESGAKNPYPSPLSSVTNGVVSTAGTGAVSKSP